MDIITLTYKVTPEKEGGFSIVCLDWDGVITQGETMSECKKNAIEATELMLEVLKTHKIQKPKIRAHQANIYHFQLSFDKSKCKVIKPDAIFRNLRKMAGIL